MKPASPEREPEGDTESRPLEGKATLAAAGLEKVRKELAEQERPERNGEEKDGGLGERGGFQISGRELGAGKRRRRNPQDGCPSRDGHESHGPGRSENPPQETAWQPGSEASGDHTADRRLAIGAARSRIGGRWRIDSRGTKHGRTMSAEF